MDRHLNMFGYSMLCGIITGPIIGCLFDKDMLRGKKRKGITKYADRLMTTFWPYVITLLLSLLFQVMAIVNKLQCMVSYPQEVLNLSFSLE